MSIPSFGSHLNPISTRGADYAHPMYWCPHQVLKATGAPDCSHIISEVGLIKNLKPIFPKRACKIQILNKLVFGDIANYHGAPFTICNHPLHPDVGVSCCPHSDKLSEFLAWHRFFTGIYYLVKKKIVLQFGGKPVQRIF